MTKAERRRKARARARERESAGTASDALEQAVAAAAAGEPEKGVEEDASEAETESEFITGPVTERRIDRRPVGGTTLGGELIADRQRRLRAEAEVEGDDDVDLLGDEDEDDEDVEGDEDADLDDQEDALFELACAAVEQGDALGWPEAAALLMTAEVLDPRLALVVGLLVDGAPEDEEAAAKHVPLPLTGQRVLQVLEDIGLGELVAEAKEVTELDPDGGEDSPEERAVVRTSARELNELSKRELADGSRGQKGVKDKQRPLRASDVKAKKASPGAGVTGPRRQG